MKVWLTRDSLTTGVIKEAEGHVKTGRPGSLQVSGRLVGDRDFHPNQWHASREAAVAQVLRDAKRLRGWKVLQIQTALVRVQALDLMIERFSAEAAP